MDMCHSKFTDDELFQKSFIQFKDSFDLPSHEYFPYIQTISALSMLSISLIAYGGISADRIQQVKRAYVNEVIGIVIAILMFLSAYKNYLIYEENCNDTYNDETSKTYFCSSLIVFLRKRCLSLFIDLNCFFVLSK